MLRRSYDSLVKTARSRVRLHSFYAQKPVQIHQTYFPPPLFSARALNVRAQIRLARETKVYTAKQRARISHGRITLAKRARALTCAQLYLRWSPTELERIQRRLPKRKCNATKLLKTELERIQRRHPKRMCKSYCNETPKNGQTLNNAVQ